MSYRKRKKLYIDHPQSYQSRKPYQRTSREPRHITELKSFINQANISSIRNVYHNVIRGTLFMNNTMNALTMIIGGMKRRRLYDECFRLFEQMKVDQLRPTVITYSVMVDVYIKANKPQALKYFSLAYPDFKLKPHSSC